MLPLRSLRQLRVCLVCNVLDDEDGILILRIGKDNNRMQSLFVRVFLTDSGHYLMPIDAFSCDFAKTEQEALRAVFKKYCLSCIRTDSAGHHKPRHRKRLVLHTRQHADSSLDELADSTGDDFSDDETDTDTTPANSDA